MRLCEGHARYYERKYDAARGWLDLDAEIKDEYASAAPRVLTSTKAK